MEIVNKRENYDYGIYYDMESNQADTLKLIKLITIFLQERENIDINDLYELIKYFYTIKIETKDYLDYLNQTKGTDFDKTVEIPTKIVVMDRTSEGHGRDFSWWHETRQLMIELITPEGLVIDKKHDYSSEEIKEIFNNYKVYLFDYSNKELGIDPKLPFVKETSIGIKIPMFKLVDYDEEDYSGFELGQIKYEDENFNEIIKQTGYKLVRRKIKLTTVFKFAKDIFESIYNNINYYENEILKCSFIKEQEKEELIQRIRILINKMGVENPKIILNQLEQSGPVLVKKKTPSKHK